jgi:hypothetical protein
MTDNSDDPPKRVRFDADTRESLAQGFISECKKAHPNGSQDGVATEAKIFVGCLERFASTIPLERQLLEQVEPQQRRRERVKALANALDGVIDIAVGMDDASLSFAIFRGIEELIAEHPEESVLRIQSGWTEDRGLRPEESVLRRIQAGWTGDRGLRPARDLKNAKSEFAAFVHGVRKAVEELEMPSHARRSAEEHLAAWIEDYLGRIGLPFTTTDTGFSGSAFMATMALVDGAGALDKTAKNVLRKAANSEESWKNFAAIIHSRKLS